MKDDHVLGVVLERVSEYVPLSSIMIVGATCRDIHQESFRSTEPSRTTDDIDLALAVEGWDEVRILQREFPSRSRAWQQIEVDGIAVDIVPFGSIESPPGEVLVGDGLVLNVSGFREVFERAETHELSSGMKFKLPSVAGLAALKLHAWLDRYRVGNYKDAQDLGLILAWYAESDEGWLFDRFFEHKEAHEADILEVMAAFLLGIDVAEALGEAESASLAGRFRQESASGMELFAEKLVSPGEHIVPMKIRAAQVQALLGGLVCVEKH